MNDIVNNNSTTKSLPFIIWTLQRTGGTNLTQRLVDRSDLTCVQHEPFNPGRLYGHITEQWIASNDESALVKEIQEIAAQRVLIKHCVEIVPWAISCALANAAVGLGYQHLFLYRKNARDRLLSLHFARETGVWGPNMKQGVDENTEVQAIAVDKLIAHEHKSISSLQRVWQHLVSQGVRPLALSYEEIYRVNPEQAVETLLPVLKALGLSKNENNDSSFAMEVIGKGDQGTRDKYQSIPGISELESALQQTLCFDPVINEAVLNIKAEILPKWVLRAQIDTMPHSLIAGQSFDLGGLVVLSPDAPPKLTLCLENNGNESTIDWEKPSPKMAKLYPENPQAAKARFKTDKLCLAENDKLILYLKDDSGKRYILFTLAELPR